MIHPEQTGKWLTHILKKAYRRPGRPVLSAAQRGRILAFAYGYLTHAAGDMWAHTLVSDVAGGVFPSVGELADVDKAEIADLAHHLSSRATSATRRRATDGSKARGPVQGEVNEDGNPAGVRRLRAHRLRRPQALHLRDVHHPGQPAAGGQQPRRADRASSWTLAGRAAGRRAARYAWDSEFDDCSLLDPDYHAHQDADGADRARDQDHDGRTYKQLRGGPLHRGGFDAGDIASDLSINNYSSRPTSSTGSTTSTSEA